MNNTLDNQKRVARPPFRYLLYAVMVTVVAMGAVYATYLTSEDVGNGMRVAHFDVGVTHSDTWSGGPYDDVAINPVNGTKTYTFTVTNNSEVALRTQLHANSVTGNTPPSIAPAGTFDLAPGTARDVQVTVTGDLAGNTVEAYATYVQID